jgi:polyisoprenoid-binding protein YceI
MTSGEGKCESDFVIGNNTKNSSLNKLSFTIPSKSLKSGHKVMDKNTYKALKANEFANISFVLSNAVVMQTDANTYQIKCSGKLTIAGTTHETDLIANGKWHAADNSLVFTGTKKMKMTDYNVTPPTVMMGTIKTGDEITITYHLDLSK